MLAYGVDMDIFMSQLRAMLKSIVVKQEYEAMRYETTAIRIKADDYISMLNAGDNWNSFASFDRDVMVAAGMSDALIDVVMKTNKESIPYEFRDLLCSLQKEKIVSDYVEENDYYRMLNGEPPINATEKDFVYMPKNIYGIPTDIPIHKLGEAHIQYFNSSGLREQVYADNPNKPYILFLGTHKISYYRARTANNFEILYIERCENKVISQDFIRLYAACRNYVMRNLYNKPDQKLYEHYDGYIGFLIMHTAVQRVFTTIFKQGIRREFYDDNLIRSLFEAYNIPYIESIDLSYQKDIAKKLNVLLQKKSSNAVLFDVVSLFNHNDVNIYKYYLIKDYYKDEEGQPIIIYKTIYDEYNNPHTIIDAEKTYDIYFQKVNIASKDISAEIADSGNRIEYQSLCGDDPYWIDDADLLNKVYDSNFNSILTKYMSIDISYELAKLMYETSHGIRMIIDDQEDYKRLYITLPYVDEPVSLYDAVIFLCALVAKKYGLNGDVPLKPHQIAQVYGFNFKEDIDALKDKITHDLQNYSGEYRAVRSQILNYLKNLNTATLEGVREMYSNIEELRIWLDTGMRYSNDIEEYEAYKKIYNSVLYVYDTQDLYTKNDGTFANTYAELLEDRRPDLYEVVKNTGNVSTTTEPGTTTDQTAASIGINNKINKVLEKLSLMSDDLSEIKYANDKDAMVSNIEKLINQMKSYTVDQSQSAILYLINDPHVCMLKFIDNIRGSNLSRVLDDKLQILYIDTLHQIIIERLWKSHLYLREEILSDKWSYIKEVLHVFDELIGEEKINNLDMGLYILDAFHYHIKEAGLYDVTHLHETIGSDAEWSVNELLKFYHKIIYMAKSGNVNDATYLYHLMGKHAEMIIPVLFSFAEDFNAIINCYIDEVIKLNDVIFNEVKDSSMTSPLNNFDIVLSLPTTDVNEHILTSEKLSKDILRYGYSPVKITESTKKDKFIKFNGDKLISLNHFIGARDDDNVSNIIKFRDELIRIAEE